MPYGMHELVRGAIRLHILHHAESGTVHGAWMASELASHGYTVSPGTLYPTLHRLEEEGLLTSSKEVVDGRALRVYEITKQGRLALREGRRVLRELADEVLR
jgi:DNA-binding PadR family transcriptional regulator